MFGIGGIWARLATGSRVGGSNAQPTASRNLGEIAHLAGLSAMAVPGSGLRTPLDGRTHTIRAVIGVVLLAVRSASHRLATDSHGRARVALPEQLTSR